ncbi:alpha/beta hydrolase [Shewanella sp. VB17]|uniref:alpha/beta hydrolase n=1 Tax=Shewanella sp. VB17 TaxID=2739432 RepID=UPI0035C8CA52
MYHGQQTRDSSLLFRIKNKHISISTLIGTWVISGLMISLATFADDTTLRSLKQSEQKHCYLEGLSEQLTCGFITVPENANRPQAKQIQIHYAVLPSIKNSNHDDAFLAIAGGPGQSAIDNAAFFNSTFSKIRQNRDILLIDQRGTGRSNALNCEVDNTESTLAANEADFDITKETQTCLDNLADSDVTQYGSLNALQDFEAVRQHLGYQKLHVYGISYGTRMAQLYMRHYPKVLSTVTLDGVVPMKRSVLDIDNAISRAIKLLIEDCTNNNLCNARYANIEAELHAIDDILALAPVIKQISDPLTSEATQLTMTRAKFTGAIRMALYVPNIRALIPHAIHQAANGNYLPILGLQALNLDSTGIAMGMNTSVVCGEDWQPLTPSQRDEANKTYFGQEMIASFEQSCSVWNMPAVDERFSAPVSSHIPTLLLSGRLDPATPPSWGEIVMEKLTNAKHFIAPYATHGVAGQSCGNDIIAQLVDTGSVSELDSKCLHKDVSRNFYLNASTVETIPEKASKPVIMQGDSHD